MTADRPHPDEAGEMRIDPIDRAPNSAHPPEVAGLRRLGTGSGFFIAPDRILTNFHVVDNCRALTVGNNVEGVEASATLIAGDRTVDLAVLSTGAAGVVGVKPARFQSGAAGPTSEKLAVVGYPEHGLPVLVAELAEVSVYVPDLMSNLRRYHFNGDVRRGNSGGPVLDETAAVVGVVTAQLNTPAIYQMTGVLVDDIGFAIANRTIFDFLRANQIEFEVAETPAPSRSSEQLLEEAHGFVRQIGCWR
jgi:S1-C subfamily serine protease